MVEVRKRRRESEESPAPLRENKRRPIEVRDSDAWDRKRIPFIGRDSNLNRRPYPYRHADRQNYTRQKVDRTKTCPMLIRVFCNVGRHNKPVEFNDKKFPENELRIYTWKDATLRELMGLLTEAFPDSRSVGTCFDFSIVYPNFKLRSFEIKDLGSTCSGQDRSDDNLSLDATKFQVGDCLDVAIFPPRQRIPKV
ncbi:hypothetical protein MXB_5545 [Myxobolus squamalis]|nr:hypothetical protein MXB_5545 [Myxobolus squamalis]